MAWPAALALAMTLLATAGCGSPARLDHPRDVTRAFKDYAGQKFTLPWMRAVSSATIQPSGALDVRTSLDASARGREVGSIVWGYGNLFAHDTDLGRITEVRVLGGHGETLESARTHRPQGY